MIVGSIVVAICLLVLGWTSQIVGLFVKDAERVCGVGFLVWVALTV